MRTELGERYSFRSLALMQSLLPDLCGAGSVYWPEMWGSIGSFQARLKENDFVSFMQTSVFTTHVNRTFIMTHRGRPR